MFIDFKKHVVRHHPLIVIGSITILCASIQYLILSDLEINQIHSIYGDFNQSAIFQKLTMDLCSVFLIIYYVFTSASSIISDYKYGVFIYDLARGVSSLEIIITRYLSLLLYVLLSNFIAIFITTIISIFYGGMEIDLLKNGSILLFSLSYKSAFYIALAIFIALLFKNYVLSLSIFFIAEVIQLIFYRQISEHTFRSVIIFNHLDVKHYFNLPAEISRYQDSFFTTILVFLTYTVVLLFVSAYIFKHKRIT
ncbi:hypothetical protein SAMN05421734_11021 [Pelagirhabdus alkalitolerans]|uniref:ABC-2 family transporter protein n=1 Tax=Pelagirhabdus alkalitolerans TaxID=1612202 RepID=A0A1G6M3Q0_9BACI|nr:ABC transporter permease subunit [Pelagirhabdus alkalitolerans]SDC50071.1 hypothetical protein SAMN05421734_11021 [Pelagirhabdus alkalitolerans]